MEEEADEKYRKGKISVWWDVDKCRVPKWCEPYTVVENIRSALMKRKYCGPISIYAYGDFDRMEKDGQQALLSTGVVLNHVSPGLKDANDKKILADMLFWAVENPAPANYLLISNDPEFSYALRHLRMKKYNILLAQPQDASESLAAAAKCVWLWTSILEGGPALSPGKSPQFGNSDISKGKEIKRAISEPNMFRALIELAQNQSQHNGSPSNPKNPHMKQFMGAPHDLFHANKPESKKFPVAPHEFFTASKEKNSSGSSTSNSIPSKSDPSCNNEVTLPNSRKLRSKNLLGQPNFTPDDSYNHGSHPSLTWPNGTNFPFYPSDMSGPDYPIDFCYPRTFQQQNGREAKQDYAVYSSTPQYLQIPNNVPHIFHGSQKNGYRPRRIDLTPTSSSAEITNLISHKPSEYVQALIGVILLTLNTLKNDKMIPTEANISDCIKYGNPIHQDTDVKEALYHAVEQQMIVKLSIGAVQLYLGKNAKIWKCVDPMANDPTKYPEEIWDELKKYLTYSGRSAMMASQCRYEAALSLKQSCLKDLVLGDVLQILNMMITNKRWIKTHRSGWQPIKINLPQDYTDAVANTSD